MSSELVRTQFTDVSSKMASDTVVERAHRACEKCTRTKKKCDKLLPACSRCTRLATVCCYEFTYTAPSTAVVEPAALVGHFMGGPTSSDLSGKFSIFESGLEVSSEVIMAVIKSRQLDWRECVRDFFANINPNLGIVHWNAFQRKIEGLGPNDSPQTQEVALLVVCMQLVLEYSNSGEHITRSSQIAKLPAYIVAKRLFYLLKESAAPGVELVQCAALICAFEFAHGLPARAYTTMGHVATMASLIDVKPVKYHLSTTNQSVGIAEEERRLLYWSTFVLERSLHMDSHVMFLPHLIVSPAEDDLLPPNIGGLDSQANSPPPFMTNERYPLNTDTSTSLSAFQRICQCAVLWERALQWEKDNVHQNQIISVKSFSGLETSTRNMLESILCQPHKWGDAYGSFSICTCLLLRLYASVLKAAGVHGLDPAQTDNVEVLKARAGINSTVRLITDTTADMNDHFGRRPELLAACSPLTAYSTFACLESLNIFEPVISEAASNFHDMWNTLHFFSKRWGVAVQLIERVEALLEDDGSNKPQPVSTSAMSIDVFSVGPFR